MSIIQEMPEFLQKGRAKNVKALVQQALDEGLDPKEILNEGLLSGMMIIGAKFKNNEVFEIHDLGVDVAPETFVEKAEEVGADVICMSALLTTTMPGMQDCVDQLKEKGLRDKYIVMVGGAPVNENFAQQIGADYYTPDAASAAEVAKEAVLAK